MLGYRGGKADRERLRRGRVQSTKIFLGFMMFFGSSACDSAQQMLKHVAGLWGFGVHIESVDAAGSVRKRWSVAAPA